MNISNVIRNPLAALNRRFARKSNKLAARREHAIIEPLEARIAPAVFSNPAAITINDNAAAVPYPSSIVVSGLGDALTDINVTLTGWNHTFPDDVDILLVGPGGQNLILMSDVGGLRHC